MLLRQNYVKKFNQNTQVGTQSSRNNITNESSFGKQLIWVYLRTDSKTIFYYILNDDSKCTPSVIKRVKETKSNTATSYLRQEMQMLLLN